MQSEHVQHLGRVAAERRESPCDPIKEIEVLRLRELLCLGNAGGELLPRHNGFDCGKGIAAILFGLKQSLPDSSIHSEFVVDRPPVPLELLLMLVLRSIEQLVHDPVMKIDHLIGDGRGSFYRKRDQGCIPALPLELHQVGRRHLSAFAGNLQQPILMRAACAPILRNNS